MLKQVPATVEIPSHVPMPKSPEKKASSPKGSPKFGTMPSVGEDPNLSSLNLPEPTITPEVKKSNALEIKDADPAIVAVGASKAAPVLAVAASAIHHQIPLDTAHPSETDLTEPTTFAKLGRSVSAPSTAPHRTAAHFEAAVVVEAVAPVVASQPPISWARLAALNPPAAVPPAEHKLKSKAAKEPKNVAVSDREDETGTKYEATPAPTKKERASHRHDTAELLEASVFVSGVPQTCGEERLKELFSKHGEVIKVSIKADKHFAIIDFSASESAEDALKIPSLKCDSSIMKVEPRRRAGAPEKPKSGGKGDKGEKAEKGEGRGGDRNGERGRGRGRDGGKGEGKDGEKGEGKEGKDGGRKEGGKGGGKRKEPS